MKLDLSPALFLFVVEPDNIVSEQPANIVPAAVVPARLRKLRRLRFFLIVFATPLCFQDFFAVLFMLSHLRHFGVVSSFCGRFFLQPTGITVSIITRQNSFVVFIFGYLPYNLCLVTCAS